jgi:type I restriction enzyme, S subunit
MLPYLRVANVKAGYLVLDEIKTIDVAVDEVERYSLFVGDVLLTEGGDWDKLGRSAIWTGEIEPCLHQNRIFRARPLSEQLLPEWVSLFTNSQAGRKYFQSKAKRATNLAAINMTELRSTPLPVPPAAEQRRILSRLAEIETLLARLDAALLNAHARAGQIADLLTGAG